MAEQSGAGSSGVELPHLAGRLVPWRPVTDSGAGTALGGAAASGFVALMAFIISFQRSWTRIEEIARVPEAGMVLEVGTTITAYFALLTTVLLVRIPYRRWRFLSASKKLLESIELHHHTSQRFAIAEAIGRRDALLESRDLALAERLDAVVMKASGMKSDARPPETDGV